MKPSSSPRAGQAAAHRRSETQVPALAATIGVLGALALPWSGAAAEAQPATPPPPIEDPSLPPQEPPPGFPPGGYGYRPPGGAPSPPRAGFRPFTLGLGLGIGGLAFRDGYGRAREGGLSYTLRVGFGVTGGWLVFIGAEGTGANHLTYGVWQTAYLLGAQYLVADHLHLRAGFGVANATAADASGLPIGGTGAAFMGAVGSELAQGSSTSLGLELSVTAARQRDETWSNFGLNFVLSFF
jgi:hypothetical protein